MQKNKTNPESENDRISNYQINRLTPIIMIDKQTGQIHKVYEVDYNVQVIGLDKKTNNSRIKSNQELTDKKSNDGWINHKYLLIELTTTQENNQALKILGTGI